MVSVHSFLAAGLMLATAAAPPDASAAADNTLGMALLSAGIHTNGDVAFGSGLQTSSYIGTGTYRLFFNRPISMCAQVVTPRLSGVSAYITPSVDANGITVTVLDVDNGAATDTPFHVVVFCNE